MTQELFPLQRKHLDSHQVSKMKMNSGLNRNDPSKRPSKVAVKLIPRIRAEGWLTRLQGST